MQTRRGHDLDAAISDESSCEGEVDEVTCIDADYDELSQSATPGKQYNSIM